MNIIEFEFEFEILIKIWHLGPISSALSVNISLGYNWLMMTNTLAYYNIQTQNYKKIVFQVWWIHLVQHEKMGHQCLCSCRGFFRQVHLGSKCDNKIWTGGKLTIFLHFFFRLVLLNSWSVVKSSPLQLYHSNNEKYVVP